MRKLYRSTRDSKLFGVCGGLAEYLAIDATLLRILLVIVAVFSAGSVIVVYIIAGIIIPKEPNYGGFGGSPHDQGWGRQDQPNHGFGSSNWNQGSQYPGAGPGPGPGYAQTTRPGPSASVPPASHRPPQGIDAMMEDIEKKSLQREIEELKARISKFENQSKGE